MCSYIVETTCPDKMGTFRMAWLGVTAKGNARKAVGAFFALGGPTVAADQKERAHEATAPWPRRAF